ncbi:DUF922 domain-containing protein [Aggregatimonas sangjinii]|uniref:DUF922 domain-containing protein n=2 Tax=Aggregatimonas sangjinii TaxID=2583587 RepID=A0A5B7SVR2_9FLAO|nr:DUF922 domain-containing protein [Aggregatimonas sangjinii]
MGISFGQQESQIPWSQEVRLTWADFKGKPTSDDAAATTASGISYRFSTNTWGNQVEIEFVVTTHFYPEKSWYRPELCDAQILRHEQLHFDISEVFARKMRTRLAATKFTKDVKAEVAKIYDEINMALYAFQNRYDNETNFSRHREKQSEWNRKIADILKD